MLGAKLQAKLTFLILSGVTHHRLVFLQTGCVTDFLTAQMGRMSYTVQPQQQQDRVSVLCDPRRGTVLHVCSADTMSHV